MVGVIYGISSHAMQIPPAEDMYIPLADAAAPGSEGTNKQELTTP